MGLGERHWKRGSSDAYDLLSNQQQARVDAQAQKEFQIEEKKNALRLQKAKADSAKLPLPKRPRQFREPKPEILADLAFVGKAKAATALGKTTRTIDRLVETGKLTPVGGSGRKRFKTKDLLAFLNKKIRPQNETK